MNAFTRREFVGAAMGTVLSSAAAQASNNPLLDYFRDSGPKLLRPAQGLFSHPSIAPSLPGKRYAAELWDWDTLWTARGLFRLGELTSRDFLKSVGEHAKGSLFNFFAFQSTDGRLPIVMSSGDKDENRFPFKAPERNQAKPVMGQLAWLITEKTGEAEWARPLLQKLIAFHDSWLAHNESKCGLLVWSNDVAIGNDNDPTSFARPPFSSANLLLNCLFYEDVLAVRQLAEKLGVSEDILDKLRRREQKIHDAIQRQCWDERDAFYYTADVQVVDRRKELIPNVAPGMATSWQTLPLRLQVFTGFLPLWCGIATPQNAKALVQHNYLADDRFRAAYGVRTLSRLEAMYSLEFSSNPSNWLGPVWIISNYFVWWGLKRYGFDDLARELADKTIRLLSADLAENGSLNEYYHPDTGAALSHKGFMDWNLLVLEMM
jgi:putative isomerase